MVILQNITINRNCLIFLFIISINEEFVKNNTLTYTRILSYTSKHICIFSMFISLSLEIVITLKPS